MNEIIKEYIDKRNLTNAETERACKLSNGTISKWDRVKPSFESVIRVSRFLKIPLSKLASCVPEEKGE